ncbi:MAG: hypothetical protein KBS86_03770 [Proteobacteria bacterium]|nr:hypothetical protein [Candidatus Enterousia scatequi]
MAGDTVTTLRATVLRDVASAGRTFAVRADTDDLFDPLLTCCVADLDTRPFRDARLVTFSIRLGAVARDVTTALRPVALDVRCVTVFEFSLEMMFASLRLAQKALCTKHAHSTKNSKKTCFLLNKTLSYIGKGSKYSYH